MTTGWADILVVDDDEDVLEIMTDRLVLMGFEVRTAQTGLECLEAFRRETPDLVLLDLRLPDVSGMEVLDTLQARAPRVPVVIVSASTEREAAQEALRKGAAAYLLKPFGPEQLKEKVFRTLHLEVT